jgi:SAM-dependent methyltransferase
VRRSRCYYRCVGTYAVPTDSPHRPGVSLEPAADDLRAGSAENGAVPEGSNLAADLLQEVQRGSSDNLTRAFVRRRLRTVAEDRWAVSAERELERKAGPLGALLVHVKVALRKVMRWYVEPLARDQRAFNDSALKLIDELFEEVDVLTGDLGRAERELTDRREDARLIGELQERLVRVERRTRNAPATVATQPRADALPDYFAFSSRMRGSAGSVRDRQLPYVELLRTNAPVLDVGCGRGELLALLRDEAIEARGIEADGDMVAYAVGEGLDVEQTDAVDYLRGLPDGSFGSIFCAQVVEHLPPSVLVRLLELARAKLRPGGVLIMETINPLSPLALRFYFSDLTHAQPLVPETLELLAQGAGFRRTAIDYLNAPEEQLCDVELPAGKEFDGARAALAANVQRLNEVVFGPLDYALYAWA